MIFDSRFTIWLKRAPLALFLSTFNCHFSTVLAGTTMDAANHSAYGANLGWMDWRGDTNHGAVIGQYVCSGYTYSANAGWINLGSGAPANGIRYQNNSATDFGVNNDGAGNLSGLAWGANIGWLTFEQTYGKPNVNLRTGALSGYVWSANCGWISLSNAAAHVQTDSLYPGPLAPNGLPVPWLLAYFGATNVSATADPTGKGMTLAQDYVAGTDPTNADSILRITGEDFSPSGASASITWSSVPTRVYFIQKSPDLATTNWTDSGLGLISPSAGPATMANFTDTNAPARFYRVQAVLPLSP
jgi:hypothetical protein